jgi:hypothetical protein
MGWVVGGGKRDAATFCLEGVRLQNSTSPLSLPRPAPPCPLHQEDAAVVNLVRIHGAKKWSLIADNLPGRIGKQCRER